MESTVKERLIEYLAYKQISQKKFAEIVGLSSGYVNAIKNSIQPKTLHKIAMQFPDLNTGWLITGDGDMLKEIQQVGNYSSGVVINGSRMNNSPIDNRQYYSDSPDVLRAQIDLLDERLKEKEERLKEKDAQIKEKDAQIKEKDAQIKQLLDILQGKK